MPWRAFEDDDFVAARAAFQARGVFAAWAFHEDLDGAAQKTFIARFADGINFREQTRVALFDGLFWQLIGHFGGRRVAALRIFENVGVVELRFVRERNRFGKILFGLAGETNNDISGDPDFWTRGAKF